MDFIKAQNVNAWRIDCQSDSLIPCDTIYLFLQEGDSMLMGYAYSNGNETVIRELYSLKMNEKLPEKFFITSFKEVTDKEEILKYYISLNPENNSMSITFGALSSYIATGSYEIDGSILTFTTDSASSINQQKSIYVFDISGNKLIFNSSLSINTSNMKDKTEFERFYQIYPDSDATFFDLESDGRYELVRVGESDINGEFALSFSVFCRGETYPTVKIPFQKYDYITLEKENGSLVLICKNKDIIIHEEKYCVEYLNKTFVLTKIG